MGKCSVDFNAVPELRCPWSSYRIFMILRHLHDGSGLSHSLSKEGMVHQESLTSLIFNLLKNERGREPNIVSILRCLADVILPKIYH